MLIEGLIIGGVLVSNRPQLVIKNLQGTFPNIKGDVIAIDGTGLEELLIASVRSMIFSLSISAIVFTP